MFRLQKYKKFESNSQHLAKWFFNNSVVSTAKVQKIWEQFTTSLRRSPWFLELFRLQKYKKFESNSQPSFTPYIQNISCFDCKSTKNLRAIHNDTVSSRTGRWVVSTAKVQKIWEQFTTGAEQHINADVLFRLQKYKKFESNSQQ